ncbi:hypothetical protein LEP1GSC086_2469 [Leptospira weilii str. LNT 1234]|nr:hypothetical protein LEP1GSC086_2469 [Leptospira weilii str. LNT 1234]
MSKILHLNVGFVLKLTVLYFIGISKINFPVFTSSFKPQKNAQTHLRKR